MILIDALYINNGGGKILLDYLIKNLEECEIEVFYLLDSRVKEKMPVIKETNTAYYLDASLYNRRKFYKNNKNNFRKVLCFGNIPPNIRLKCKVYTYFQQGLFVEIPKNFSKKDKISFMIKQFILNYFKNNTDFWLVQSELMSVGLQNKYGISASKILQMPFYVPLEKKDFPKEKDLYIYISNVNPHKNHHRLIEAFCRFYDEYNFGRLLLTIGSEHVEILKLIAEKKSKNYPIDNIGFVPQRKLSEVYSKANYHIFPSFAESFGLGLVEAIEADCKIIGADLPYTFAVCEPSLTFNPEEIESIVKSFSLSMSSEIKSSISKVSNRINDLIKLLK